MTLLVALVLVHLPQQQLLHYRSAHITVNSPSFPQQQPNHHARRLTTTDSQHHPPVPARPWLIPQVQAQTCEGPPTLSPSSPSWQPKLDLLTFS
ncbi:hypothetical protein BGW80DRAFT_1347762 [Lactifluus volemus]|nr:hypothetical protein BGW80DRAFT_1352394 [Lactifluus volemus]KAH9964337.1 hypothetical protein BGW80DRAFT_1347762 [Lactifluus volemus]